MCSNAPSNCDKVSCDTKLVELYSLFDRIQLVLDLLKNNATLPNVARFVMMAFFGVAPCNLTNSQIQNLTTLPIICNIYSNIIVIIDDLSDVLRFVRNVFDTIQKKLSTCQTADTCCIMRQILTYLITNLSFLLSNGVQFILNVLSQSNLLADKSLYRNVYLGLCGITPEIKGYDSGCMLDPVKVLNELECNIDCLVAYNLSQGCSFWDPFLIGLKDLTLQPNLSQDFYVYAPQIVKLLCTLKANAIPTNFGCQSDNINSTVLKLFTDLAHVGLVISNGSSSQILEDIINAITAMKTNINPKPGAMCLAKNPCLTYISLIGTELEKIIDRGLFPPLVELGQNYQVLINFKQLLDPLIRLPEVYNNLICTSSCKTLGNLKITVKTDYIIDTICGLQQAYDALITNIGKIPCQIISCPPISPLTSDIHTLSEMALVYRPSQQHEMLMRQIFEQENKALKEERLAHLSRGKVSSSRK